MGSVVEGLIACGTALSIMQALDHGHILLILAASVAAVHLVSQVYLTIEASMVWWKSLDAATATKEATVGPPVILGREKETDVESSEAEVEAGKGASASEVGDEV